MTSPVGSHSSVTFTNEVNCYVWKTSASSATRLEHLNACYCVHNIIVYNICYCVNNIIIYNICYCVHNIIILLVLVQQRQDSDDARSNSRADWPELQNYRLKVEIFQLGAKIAAIKTLVCKRVPHIALPQMRRPEKCCVYRSHTRLYVDFSWDSVARRNCVAFGVNAPHLKAYMHILQGILINYRAVSDCVYLYSHFANYITPNTLNY